MKAINKMSTPIETSSKLENKGPVSYIRRGDEHKSVGKAKQKKVWSKEIGLYMHIRKKKRIMIQFTCGHKYFILFYLCIFNFIVNAEQLTVFQFGASLKSLFGNDWRVKISLISICNDIRCIGKQRSSYE